MRKKISLLIPLITLSACNTSSDSLNIIAPTGAASLAFYQEIDNPNFQTNSTPSNVLAFMNDTSTMDLVVIDTVSGLKAINNGVNFSLAATLTFGNFFIASTGHDTDEIMDIDDKIILFGKNQTPDHIFHYIYGDKYNDSIEYVNNVSDAQNILISGTNLITQTEADYVFIAEPALYAALHNEKTSKNAKVYANIQELYKNKSGLDMIQASLFVNNKSDRKKINHYLTNLESNINDLINSPSLLTSYLNDYDTNLVKSIFGVMPKVAENVLKDNNGIGLGFKKAIDNKAAIDSFINLFGMGETNEENYYK